MAITATRLALETVSGPCTESAFLVQLATIVQASSAPGNSLGRHIFLIDYENVQPTGIGSLVAGSCKIMIFLGQNQSKLPVALTKALQPLGADVEYLQISGSGSNAADFHIAFYIGRLAMSHPDAKFTIVSKDTGFDPLVKHLASLKIACSRSASMSGSAKLPSPKAAPVTKMATAKETLATKPKPAKNVVVTILPEANGGDAKAKSTPTPTPTSTLSPARVTEVVALLKGMKASKPAKLKTLQSSMKSWFKPALKPDEVASVIAALQASKKIAVKDTKVVYTLG